VEGISRGLIEIIFRHLPEKPSKIPKNL